VFIGGKDKLWELKNKNGGFRMRVPCKSIAIAGSGVPIGETKKPFR